MNYSFSRTFEDKYIQINERYQELNPRESLFSIDFIAIKKDLNSRFPFYYKSNPIFLALVYFYLQYPESYNFILEEYLNEDNKNINKITFRRYYRILTKNDPFQLIKEKESN